MKKTPATQRISALVIEQDEQLRESMRFNLHLDGFEVETVPDSDSGLSSAAKNKPRLIIIDTDDQIEAVRNFKNTPETQNIPLILITQSTAIDELDKLFNAGADDYLTKPFNSGEFGKIIKAKLEKCEQKISQQPQSSESITILVIDDDNAIHEIVKQNLSRNGFEVHKAVDGPTGIDAAIKIIPELILLDIMMPGMNGLEVLSTLKHNERTSNIPVFMITAEKLVGDIDRAFEIGADDYLPKPIHGPKLASILKEKLEKIKTAKLFNPAT
ncbi:MAG: response regulator [Planctomycetota bacterium]|jgi:DNA-binding response OmpR family regulator